MKGLLLSQIRRATPDAKTAVRVLPIRVYWSELLGLRRPQSRGQQASTSADVIVVPHGGIRLTSPSLHLRRVRLEENSFRFQI